jgi:gluconolactonase
MPRLLRIVTVLCIFAIMISLCSSLVQAADVPAPTGESIVAPDAKLELLYTRTAPIQGGLTEGAAVAPDGSIYFSDIPLGQDKGLIVRFDPKTKQTAVFATDSSKSNGLIFTADGSLLACEGSDYGGRRVSKWDIKTGRRTTVADNYQGKKFNAPNDLCLDRQGRIYFTDPRYLGDEPRELTHRSVYRIDLDGKVTEVTHDISKPNGIAMSPNGKTLYVADHDNGTDKIDATKPAPKQGPMKIYGFPLGADGYVAGERKTVVDFGEGKGCDGMTVDTEGNLYLTVRNSQRPGVLVVNPAGAELAFIPTGPAKQTGTEPVGLPSNVEFGLGDESNVLYITIDKSLYRIGLKSKGLNSQYAK